MTEKLQGITNHDTNDKLKNTYFFKALKLNYKN